MEQLDGLKGHCIMNNVSKERQRNCYQMCFELSTRRTARFVPVGTKTIVY